MRQETTLAKKERSEEKKLLVDLDQGIKEVEKILEILEIKFRFIDPTLRVNNCARRGIAWLKEALARVSVIKRLTSQTQDFLDAAMRYRKVKYFKEERALLTRIDQLEKPITETISLLDDLEKCKLLVAHYRFIYGKIYQLAGDHIGKRSTLENHLVDLKAHKTDIENIITFHHQIMGSNHVAL